MFSAIENYAISQPHRQFTEFNFLGYFAHKHEPESYKFIDLSCSAIPENKCLQMWSWSGLTNDDIQKLQEAIG
jgi:hypothetical protein